MASQQTTGTVGAGLGGAAGFALGGPAGMAIGAGLGSMFGGMFGDSPQVPSHTSLDDIKLLNPDLYADLQASKAAMAQTQALYDQYKRGPTALETMQLAGAQQGAREQSAARGLIGSSFGQGQEQAATNNAQAQISDRHFQQQQALLQQLNAAHQQNLQNTMNAQNFMRAPSYEQYQANMQNQQGQNQFMSGLVNGGFSYLGSQNLANVYNGMGGIPGQGYNLQQPMNPGMFGNDNYQSQAFPNSYQGVPGNNNGYHLGSYNY